MAFVSVYDQNLYGKNSNRSSMNYNSKLFTITYYDIVHATYSLEVTSPCKISYMLKLSSMWSRMQGARNICKVITGTIQTYTCGKCSNTIKSG